MGVVSSNEISIPLFTHYLKNKQNRSFFGHLTTNFPIHDEEEQIWRNDCLLTSKFFDPSITFVLSFFRDWSLCDWNTSWSIKSMVLFVGIEISAFSYLFIYLILIALRNIRKHELRNEFQISSNLNVFWSDL